MSFSLLSIDNNVSNLRKTIMNILNTIKSNNVLSYLVVSYVASAAGCIAVHFDKDKTAATMMVVSATAYYKASTLEHKNTVVKLDAAVASMNTYNQELRKKLRSHGTVA